MLLLELVQMNCASSERVTVILEESFFTSNDVVLAGKSSKEWILNHFWQTSRFLKIFSIGQVFTFYDQFSRSNYFKWTVPPLKGWSISKREVYLLETIQYWLQKVPKSGSRTKFNKFIVFWGILVEAKLLLLMADPSVRISSSELCLLWKG